MGNCLETFQEYPVFSSIHPCGLISPSVRFLPQPTQLGPRFHTATSTHCHAGTECVTHWYTLVCHTRRIHTGSGGPHRYSGAKCGSHTGQCVFCGVAVCSSVWQRGEECWATQGALSPHLPHTFPPGLHRLTFSTIFLV